MSILFASPNWDEFKSPLESALEKENIKSTELTNNIEIDPLDVEFIIYSPSSSLLDFSFYKNCKAILSLWAGVDEIIKNPTINVPLVRLIDPGMQQGMIEWCISHLLRYHLSLDNYIINPTLKWQKNLKPPLANERTVGILGLGSLGSAVAKSIQKLKFNVHGWSRTYKTIPKITCHHGLKGLTQIIGICEILILLLPLTPKTKYILNKRTFQKMRNGVIIMNPGRGELINDNDMLEALDKKKVKHATLDVFCEEPLPQMHPYWFNDNVTVTPHIAAATRPASASLVLTNNILKIRRGEKPKGLVNFKNFY